MTGRRPRKKKIPAIRTVTPLDRPRLHIEFGSGSVLELNMENRLRTTMYFDLSDASIFASAATDGGKITFDSESSFHVEIFPVQAIHLALTSPDGNNGIRRVLPLENGQLRLEIKPGSVLMLNMASWLHTIRYSPLKDAAVLQSVSTDGENLIFGDVLFMDEDEWGMLALSVPSSAEEDAV